MERFFICPEKWLTDKNIKAELRLLLMIIGLSHKKGYCYASNDYFHKLFKIDKATISRQITKLINENYLDAEYSRSGCKVDERRLKLTNEKSNDLPNDLRMTKTSTNECEKHQPTNDKNVKENNINIDIIPTLNEFLKYAKEKDSDFSEKRKNLILKYESWIEAGWKTGHNKYIKNWKATLLNTLPHIPKEKKQFTQRL